MAKRTKGILAMGGGFGRLTGIVFALVVLFGVYLKVTGQIGEEVVVTVVESSEVRVEDPSIGGNETALRGAEPAASNLSGTQNATDDPIEESDLGAVAGANAANAGSDGVDNVRESLEKALGGFVAGDDAVGENVGNGLSAGDEVANEAAELGDKRERAEIPFGGLIVSGDDATYQLLEAFQRDDGTIEFTTERTDPDGTTVAVAILATCAPFSVGVISEGNGPRDDDPEMERIALGTPTATIAAYACGILR